jgi:hypothetical protein
MRLRATNESRKKRKEGRKKKPKTPSKSDDTPCELIVGWNQKSKNEERGKDDDDEEERCLALASIRGMGFVLWTDEE